MVERKEPVPLTRAERARLQRALVGAWQLVRWEVRRGDAVRCPFGPDATGYLLYTASGYMSATLMAPQRTPFAADLLLPQPAEAQKAAETFIGYCGRYTIVARDQLLHHVVASFAPNWIGDDQVRFFHLTGAMLTIHTPPLLIQGQEQVSILVWQRAAPAGVEPDPGVAGRLQSC